MGATLALVPTAGNEASEKDFFPKVHSEGEGVLLLGIYITSDGRVLFVRTPKGELQLPGGMTKPSTSRIIQFRFWLRKFAFKKTGEQFIATTLYGTFTRKITSRDGKAVYVFKLFPRKLPRRWSPTEGYEPLLIPLEEALVHPEVPGFIKEILQVLDLKHNHETHVQSLGAVIQFKKQK